MMTIRYLNYYEKNSYIILEYISYLCYILYEKFSFFIYFIYFKNQIKSNYLLIPGYLLKKGQINYGPCPLCGCGLTLTGIISWNANFLYKYLLICCRFHLNLIFVTLRRFDSMTYQIPRIDWTLLPIFPKIYFRWFFSLQNSRTVHEFVQGFVNASINEFIWYR